MVRLIACLCAVISLFLLISCAGDGSTLDPLGNPLGPPRVGVSPPELKIIVEGGQTVDITLEIQNIGGKPLEVNAIEATVLWITIQALTTPVELLASEKISVQLTIGQPNLVADIYVGAVRINSNDQKSPTFVLPIQLEVTKDILPFDATFTNIQNFIFSPVCTQCHAGANAPQGLRLDRERSFDNLVEVSSREKPELLRVKPFNPDDSYLIRKLEGGPDIIGGRMPLNQTPIPQDQINAVRRWIALGAPNN
ncbi:MAG: hypothetical protein ACE5G1_11255 [bacterium]